MSALLHPLMAALALMLVVAIATDLRARIIPNGLNLAVALTAPAWWWACGFGMGDILVQIGLACAVLAVFAGCFALGMMGGGDVKLLAALALWLQPGPLATMLVWMALGGGALTLAMLLHHRARKASGPVEVPYGVAIAGAALLLMANQVLTSPAA